MIDGCEVGDRHYPVLTYYWKLWPWPRRTLRLRCVFCQLFVEEW